MSVRRAGGFVLAAALLAAAATGCSILHPNPVSVDCNELEEPNNGVFPMIFTVANAGRVAATKLEFDVHDTGLQGEPEGESSHYTLAGPFPPGATVKPMKEDVPQPPHFVWLRFSKLDCTLERVTFADGSTWP